MGKLTKYQLEEKYKVAVYVRWDLVPKHFKVRRWFENNGVHIPKDAKPDGVKGGGMGTSTIYFLFNTDRYLTEEQKRMLLYGGNQELSLVELERPKLRTNLEK